MAGSEPRAAHLAAPRASTGRRLSEVAIIAVGARWQATAWEVAYATVWLLSGEASYVNAHPLVLDGGATSFG